MMIVLSCLVFIMTVLSGLVLIVIVLSGVVWSGLVLPCLNSSWTLVVPPFFRHRECAFWWSVCMALCCTCMSGEMLPGLCCCIHVTSFQRCVPLYVDLLNLNNLLNDSF